MCSVPATDKSSSPQGVNMTDNLEEILLLFGWAFTGQ